MTTATTSQAGQVHVEGLISDIRKTKGVYAVRFNEGPEDVLLFEAGEHGDDVRELREMLKGLPIAEFTGTRTETGEESFSYDGKIVVEGGPAYRVHTDQYLDGKGKPHRSFCVLARCGDSSED